MAQAKRWLGAPLRALYWLNYGDTSVYRSEKASEQNRLRTRPYNGPTTTTKNITDAAASRHRINRNGPFG